MLSGRASARIFLLVYPQIMPKHDRLRPDTRLCDMPNIGPAMLRDFCKLGIKTPDQLVNADPVELYHRLGELTGGYHDPCVLDVFMAAVAFANGSPAKPWWDYTAKRKKLLRADSS